MSLIRHSAPRLDRLPLMATYAIGDMQGCLAPFNAYSNRFHSTPDRPFWLVGDLVNRGPDSLALLRFIQSLGAGSSHVLGNHDLFLLAVAEGIATSRPEDTLQDFLPQQIATSYSNGFAANPSSIANDHS